MTTKTLLTAFLALTDGQQRAILACLRAFLPYADVSDEIRDEIEAEHQRLDRLVEP